jgi:hypothetical protein
VSKRQKIVITAIISSGLVLGAMLGSFGVPLAELLFIMTATYLLSVWSLQPDLSGWEYVTLLTLPVMLTAATVLTLGLDLPIPAKYVIPPVYGALIYAILLTENIFNVSAERQVPLLRAARTVGYLLTLAIGFFVSTLLFTQHLPSFVNGLVMFVVGGTIVGQALWQVALTQTDRTKLLLASLVSALAVGQLALVISFWPVAPLGAGLAIATLIYFLIGMIQHDWQENLTRRTTVEYFIVALAVLLLLFLSTSWGG